MKEGGTVTIPAHWSCMCLEFPSSKGYILSMCYRQLFILFFIVFFLLIITSYCCCYCCFIFNDIIITITIMLSFSITTGLCFNLFLLLAQCMQVVNARWLLTTWRCCYAAATTHSPRLQLAMKHQHQRHSLSPPLLYAVQHLFGNLSAHTQTR